MTIKNAIIVLIIFLILVTFYLMPKLQNKTIQPCMHSYVIVVKEKFLITTPPQTKHFVRYFNKEHNKHYIMDCQKLFMEHEIGETLTMYETSDGNAYEYTFYPIELDNLRQK